MNPVDLLIVGLICAVVVLSGLVIYKSKKSGKKCIGCPDNCACSGGNCATGCHGQCHKS